MFVCFDLETTGLSVEKGSEVVEFSYILFDSQNLFVKAEQLYFYHEGMHWSEEAYNVHQIPLEFLKTQKDKFKENIIKMYTVLNHANVVGHNSTKFDCPFAQKWLARMGLPGLTYGIQNDTMLDFKPVTKRARIKLTKLAEMRKLTPEIIDRMESIWFGDTPLPNRPHSGAYDVTATALLALDAIRNKYMFFDIPDTSNVQVTEEDINALYEDAKKELDPNRFVIPYIADGQVHYMFLNHDKSKYAITEPSFNDVEIGQRMKTSIPVALNPTDNDDVYEWSNNLFTLRLTIGDQPGDKFEIITQYGTFTEATMDMKSFITRNFKEEDYV